jgi:hypothetical protein
LYASGELSEILETHGINMERSLRCKARHASIVNALEDLRRENQQ